MINVDREYIEIVKEMAKLLTKKNKKSDCENFKNIFSDVWNIEPSDIAYLMKEDMELWLKFANYEPEDDINNLIDMLFDYEDDRNFMFEVLKELQVFDDSNLSLIRKYHDYIDNNDGFVDLLIYGKIEEFKEKFCI
ncbi:MAG: hypothetical protein E6100_05040 [Clostridium perfringens]|uniref:hypothetical protein n=1 Tax=Clostridium perfringens TaxID=1502 RepID=UPI00285810B8|nr:hypothetical protein [Clostridium perfringens]MDU4219405.1 hypothetical protein [Clostridium perfringens]MDU5489650.1 hypothetical protein [Clostridium perfringens]MDU6894445.1 hypothetical protein [Clostridium perfringens]MDU6931464.1 hypothetical protein [Clostridium perfringens]